MTPGNKVAKQVLHLIYLAIPGLLLYAPFHQGDYDYYNILRVFVFLFSGYLTLITFSNQDGYFANQGSKYPYMFGIIAIIFNPIIPFHLTREIWAPIDFISGLAILFYFIERKYYHRTNKEIKEKQDEIDRKQDEEYQKNKNIKWCKTCSKYRKIKVYEDFGNGLYLNPTIPNIEFLPCQDIDKTYIVWTKFYGQSSNRRPWFPKDCEFWNKK